MRILHTNSSLWVQIDHLISFKINSELVVHQQEARNLIMEIKGEIDKVKWTTTTITLVFRQKEEPEIIFLITDFQWPIKFNKLTGK